MNTGISMIDDSTLAGLDDRYFGDQPKDELILRELRQCLSEGGTFIDVGANVGQ